MPLNTVPHRIRLTEQFAEFLSLRKNTAALLLMVILVGLGERIAERYIPLYLLALGGGIVSIGIFAGANNLTNAFFAFFGGHLSDRFGHKTALLMFNLMTIAGYVVVIVFPYWQAVIVGSFFFASWSAISMPSTLDLIAISVPMKRRAMGVSLNSLTRRVPMILGPLLGGALIGRFGERTGIQYAFMIATVLALASLVVQQALISPVPSQPAFGRPDPFTLWKGMSAALKNLLASDILVRFCEQIPYAFVVVWCVQVVGVTPLQFGLLTSVEMVTALVIYIPVAYFADRTSKKPFVIATFCFFPLFPLFLLFSRTFTMLLLTFVVRGLKEFGEPTRKSLILDLCPTERRAGMFGFYYLLRDSVVSLAAFAGAWLWGVSPTVNLLAGFGFGVAGTILILFPLQNINGRAILRVMKPTAGER